MNIFTVEQLEDGVEYFCVHKGIVYYLTARIDDITNLSIFFLEDIHGGIDEMFPAFECSLIYLL